jgi:DNA helicase-2/ATP-dependent DNA helicase PcrA
MIDSKYQVDFYNAVQLTKDNLLAKSCPGSGKTTTLIGAMNRVPKHKKSIFIAFSKQIQLELEKRVPDNIDTSTLHSLGYKMLSNHYKTRFKVDDWKTFKFADPIVNELKTKDNKELSFKDKFVYKLTIQELINMSRLNLDSSLEGFKMTEKNYDIICKNGEVGNAIKIFDDLQMYNKRKRKDMSIDFVDMIHLPVYMNLEAPQYDFVFLDEGQDVSIVQIELIKKILKPSGRIITVADDFQAIYGFAGAASNSVEILTKAFDLKPYPLSLTYRVPKNGVELLKNINPEVECPDDAKQGIVRNGDISEAELGDLVICRNTKPLITAYFKLLEQEKKATIVGKEIESGLLKIVKELLKFTSEGALVELDKQLQEIELTLSEQGIEAPKSHWKYNSYKEKVEIITIFLDRYDTVNEAKNKIESIFHEDNDAIRLMTVHKSKGLECDKVFLITHFDNQKLIPSKFATTTEQKKQERNLEYVALSRFKDELIFVKL